MGCCSKKTVRITKTNTQNTIDSGDSGDIVINGVTFTPKAKDTPQITTQ